MKAQDGQRWRQRAEQAEHEKSRFQRQLVTARSQEQANMGRLQANLQDLRNDNKENQVSKS